MSASDLLFRLGRTGTLSESDWAALAEHDSDDVDAGLALQLDVLHRWMSDGARLGGWKIGLTSRSARDSMGIGVRPFGYVLADRVFPSGAVVTPPAGGKVEPEICVILGADLAGPDITPAQARDAVQAVAPAFEVLSPALPKGLSRSVRLGHDLNQWGIVVGPPVDPDVDLAAVHVTLTHDGNPIGTASSGPDVLDDPFVSLARVCARLANHGESLHAGDHVITGSLLPAAVVTPGSTWQATFDPIGTVTMTVGGQEN